MRFTKSAIVIAYVLATVAVVLFVASWFYTGDPAFATWLIAQACFCLLLSIWANVCS